MRRRRQAGPRAVSEKVVADKGADTRQLQAGRGFPHVISGPRNLSPRGRVLPMGHLARGKTVQQAVRVRTTAQIAGRPIHPMLVPIPIACFVGALLTDIAYVASAEIMWADFSAWLLLVGV